MVPGLAESGSIQTEAKLKREKMTKAKMMKVSSKPENGSSIYTATQHKDSS